MVKIGVFLFSLIPMPVVMLIARVAYPLFYRVVKKGKWGLKTGRIIPKVFRDRPGEWYESVLRANSLHLMKFAGEMLKAHFASDRLISKKCYIGSGKKYMDELYSSGRGFIILTCHLGNWEWAAAYIALKYKTLYAPVFVEESKGNKLLNWVRMGHNVELLEASRDPRVSALTLIRMIELLKRGEIIYLVADQAALGGNFKGRLFGAELRIFGGPFVLGQKTHAPFIPMYSLRDWRDRIALHFDKPFFLNGDKLDEDIDKVTTFFERNIAAHPEQYLWSQDRWR